ncbi:MAG TPA: hypothetical protein VMU49_10260 [Candidatus Acidoferrales bacterium]|nr:hypothetical protein [Candidatus Acidoferrales bacterium]
MGEVFAEFGSGNHRAAMPQIRARRTALEHNRSRALRRQRVDEAKSCLSGAMGGRETGGVEGVRDHPRRVLAEYRS